MRRAWLALMLLAAGAFSQPARAADARFAWRGPDCASSALLLERRLGELLEPRDRERLAGEVAVTRSAERYGVEVTIELDGRPLGTRRFEARSCPGAAETAAVAASLAVYAGEGEPKGAAESGISPDIWTRSPEPTPDFSRPRPVPKMPEPPLLEARAGVLGALEIGALPKPAWGGALELELAVGKRWSFAVLGSATTEQARAVREQQIVYLSALAAAARACVAPLLGDRYRLDACAGAQFVQARGRGEGFDVNRTATLGWAAPLLGVDFSVRAPRFIEWRSELAGSLPLSRRRFLVDGSEVSRAAAVVGSVRVGAVVRF
jgi:hypothetical protein